MSTEERRAPGAARIPFDALVEVGGALGPSFEAHAVNVSEEGMQIRTAYLPELGQEVTCRFEPSPGQSIVALGQVVWSRGAERGGEFGIRFTEIDPDSVDVLKGICGLDVGKAPGAMAGAKVRLYIDGLASPMRAKIRDARPTAITVGSDLGFLQVGKQLELEDTQSGRKRPASIDRVEVAVDPTSHIPQLVVTLRYADGPHAEATSATDDPLPGRGEPRPGDDLAFDDASARMKGAFARQAARIGPLFGRYARRAKATIALLAQRRRAEDDSAPRRTTAPPPGGGLHASGRRVVRGEAAATEEGTPMFKASTRRKAAVAAAVMTAAVLGAVIIKRTHRDVVATAPTTAGPAPEAAAPPAAMAPAPGGSAAAAAPSAMTAAAPASPAEAAASPAAVAPASTDRPAGGAMASADMTADDSRRTAHALRPRPAPFGNGPVHHGNVMRLRMDGPVEAIQGAEQPAGFTVKVPGRKSLDAAAPLAARDSRIAAIKVTNQSSGAELTVTFKDGVPNYQVSAHGESLVIALAPIGSLEKTVAKHESAMQRANRGRPSSDPAVLPRPRDRTPER